MIIYEPTSGATQRPGLRRLHVSASAQVAALLLQVEPGVEQVPPKTSPPLPQQTTVSPKCLAKPLSAFV